VTQKSEHGWRAEVLTLFPEMFPGPLGHSLAGKALEAGLWTLETIQIRDFATDRHRTVDDTPAGGGPGMVMRADVLAKALDHAAARTQGQSGPELPVIYLTPRGRPADQALMRRLAAGPGARFLCGRYEGIDERLLQRRAIEEVSLGDFVLSGGEIAALTIIDAVVRLLPGVLGAVETLDEESFENGLLEYPHYTRPAVWEGQEIPAVLTSGHHGEIARWRRRQAEDLTKERRPDLWARYDANRIDRDHKNRGKP
jgi:tRNA (guanine37-N1)-methyltransferase